ncbi:MAG: ArsR family transcriptional regulator [Phycisphaeraceae bacterium]|nr:ArsR family transcriptional regulator [Phycisphaeraceae bacterium]
MQLNPIERRFILHWGEMGSRWGVNRTVAQIHALLYIREEPMNAEEIAETLQVARSNVSTSLRELIGWGIVHTEPVLGDRRDHYVSMKDVWAMFEKILDERKRRECDPTMDVLAECLAEARQPGAPDGLAERLAEMQKFFDTMSTFYQALRRLPTGSFRSFFRMSSRMKKFMGLSA